MINLFKRGASLGWRPDSDAVNASDGVLLRADNVVPDEIGGLALRRGSTNLYSSLIGSSANDDVQSVYSAAIDVSGTDTTFDVAAVYDSIWIANKTNSDTSMAQKGFMDMSTGADVVFGNDSYQIFMARNNVKKKWDGTHFYNWGISPPSQKVTCTAGTVVSKTFIDFDSSEAVGGTITVHEGSGATANATGQDGVASSAIELTPDPGTGRAAVSKVFTAYQDMYNINGTAGTDRDLIDLYVWIEEPKKVDKITLMFGCTAGSGTGEVTAPSDPFKTDYYYFDFNLKDAQEVGIKDVAAYQASSYASAVNRLANVTDPEDVTNTKTVADTKKALAGLSGYVGAYARGRADSSQASPAWTHFTVTRGQMRRVGNTNGRDWKKVWGIKIVYDAVPGSTEKARFDDLIVVGGGDRALTGTFQVLYRYANYNSSGAYYELSPISPASDKIVLNQQKLTITFPAAIWSEADPQVDQIWVYLFGGYMDRYYRVGILPFVATTEAWSMDEFSRIADGAPPETELVTRAAVSSSADTTHLVLGTADTGYTVSTDDDYYNTMLLTIISGPGEGQHLVVNDYVGGTKTIETTTAMSPQPTSASKVSIFAASTSMTASEEADLRRGMALEFGIGASGISMATLDYTLSKNDWDAVLDGEALEPGTVSLPDNIVAIAGPWLNRMYLVTSAGYVYPTSSTSPSNCSVFHTLDIRRYGTPKWMVKTNGGIYVGSTNDVIRIAGSGDESDDRSKVDLYADPLNIAHPPVDACVYTDGNTVIYRSADGLMTLNGVTINPLVTGGTNLLWRGYDRHGISKLNTTTGRFRIVTDNQMLFFLVTEGTVTTPTAIWRLPLGMPSPAWARTSYASSILSIFRASDGRLLAGTTAGTVMELESGTSDNGTAISVTIKWPWLDGGRPLVRKVPLDFQLWANTGGSTATINFYTDGDSTTPSKTLTALTRLDEVYRNDATGIATFLRIMPEITGDFVGFRMHGFNLTARELVQHAMVVDTDYIIPPEPQDIVWLQEAEVDCISPSDLTMYVYVDDVLYTTQTVTVTANVRSVYVVPLPRGTKGRRPRAVIKTTASDARNQVGFECFRVRFRTVGSGNYFEVPFQTTAPVGG